MVSVVCIYCKDGRIARIAEDFASQGATLHLWALDEIVSSVGRWTRGVGPGDKTANLNRLFPYFKDAQRVLFTDDDIEFPPDFLRDFLAIVDRFGLELAQPALSHESAHSLPQTLARPELLVRETNWVEQMVFTMGRAMIQRVMPAPLDFWMGWGVEMIWEKALRQNGRRAGIVDRTPVHHRSRALFSRYNQKDASRRMRTALRDRGLSRVPMRTLRAFSDRGACSWVVPSAERFIATLKRNAGAARLGDLRGLTGSGDRIGDTFSVPLRPYWRALQLMYGELHSAFADDPEIIALFEADVTLSTRERFVIDSASLLRECGRERHR